MEEQIKIIQSLFITITCTVEKRDDTDANGRGNKIYYLFKAWVDNKSRGIKLYIFILANVKIIHRYFNNNRFVMDAKKSFVSFRKIKFENLFSVHS